MTGHTFPISDDRLVCTRHRNAKEKLK